MGIQIEISLRQQALYNSSTNAFDPKKKAQVKVSKPTSYFFESPQKSDPKVENR